MEIVPHDKWPYEPCEDLSVCVQIENFDPLIWDNPILYGAAALRCLDIRLIPANYSYPLSFFFCSHLLL